MTRAFLVLALVLPAVPAAAQQSGQAGLAVGAPGSIGIIWHVSDAIAIRPDFSFSHTHSEGTSSVVTTDSWGAGFGASALFYTGKIHDNVRTYLTPRFGYARTNASTRLSGAVTNPEQHQNSYSYSGAFGIQFTPTRRFSVYGEAGLQYSTVDSTYKSAGPITLSEGKTTNSQFGSRAGVGIVWYFN